MNKDEHIDKIFDGLQTARELFSQHLDFKRLEEIKQLTAENKRLKEINNVLFNALWHFEKLGDEDGTTN